MAEQLAFDQRRAERRQVDRHQLRAAAQRMAMNRAGHELLAGATFARDQYRGIGPRHERDALENFLHRGAAAEQFVLDAAGADRSRRARPRRSGAHARATTFAAWSKSNGLIR